MIRMIKNSDGACTRSDKSARCPPIRETVTWTASPWPNYVLRRHPNLILRRHPNLLRQHPVLFTATPRSTVDSPVCSLIDLLNRLDRRRVSSTQP